MLNFPPDLRGSFGCYAMLACSRLSGSCKFYILCSDSQKERPLPVINLLILYGYTYCVGCVLQDPGPTDKSCGRTLGIVARGGGGQMIITSA